MNEIEFALFLLFFCLSFRIFIRKVGIIAEKFFFEEKFVPKIVFMVGFLQLIVIFLFKDQLWMLAIALLAFLFGVDRLENYFFSRLRKKIAKQRILLLNFVLLGVCSGKTIRQSAREQLGKLDPYFVKVLKRSWLEKSDEEKHKKLFFEAEELIISLQDAEKNPFSARSLLEGQRRRLLTQEKFDQKSRQVLAQVDAQVLVMGFLYIGFLIFIISNQKISEIWRYLIWSIGFFSAGGLLSWRMKRSFKWKI
jgi:hypothetical protein